MIIGSHNSWSFLRPRKWWMRLIAFTARCQRYDIRTQYETYGVRCFDLRLRFTDQGNIIIAHGLVEYENHQQRLLFDELPFLDKKGDVFVRVILETRSKKQYTPLQVSCFRQYCQKFVEIYPNIHFWCGRNLFNWEVDYAFKEEPTCEEKYSSVCPPKVIDDWWPWLYAWIHNPKNISQGTKSDILLIDYVDIN